MEKDKTLAAKSPLSPKPMKASSPHPAVLNSTAKSSAEEKAPAVLDLEEEAFVLDQLEKEIFDFIF